ncbi:MAG TPA: alpha/beta hydrolase [Pyrinomonadaceae bacterium]|nr:alpha/beta hydrolase [Pyrinomonadaceae bacterium]
MSEELEPVEGALRHGYAQVGGVRLHYAERGEGNELVIMLHGFPECWYSWRHQLKHLGERYHVVAPDMRGYNLSDKPPRVEDYRMDNLIDDVTGLIRHFGKDRAVVVGHDWGAAVAWGVALKHPEYVSRLVAMQVPPPAAWRANMTLKQALRSWYMLFFQIPLLPEWLISLNDFASIERSFKDTPGNRNAFTETDIAVYKKALREPNALTSAINYYRANFVSLFFKQQKKNESEDLRDYRVRVPTLLIYGERDKFIVPETLRDLNRFVDAPYREARFKSYGHWIQNEAPDEVNAELETFLDAQPSTL